MVRAPRRDGVRSGIAASARIRRSCRSVAILASGEPSAWKSGRPVSAAVAIGEPGSGPIRFHSGGSRSSASSIISPRIRRT
jgi:hypothetical protein